MKSPSLVMLRLLLSACLCLCSAISAAQAQTQVPDVFRTPVELEQLDPAAFTQLVDGAERPVVAQDGKQSVPQDVIATRTTWKLGSRKFGDSKTPGARHVRIGFLQPVEIGTVLVGGDVSLSILKPDATYPGDMADDSQWISARRISGGELVESAAKEGQGA